MNEKQSEIFLNILQDIFPKEKKRLLEIGAGRGEFSLYLSQHFNNVLWIVSEKSSALLPLKKLHPKALAFEVGKDDFPKTPVDYVLLNDVLHELTWKQAKGLMKDFGHRLREGSQVFIVDYFKYNDQFLGSESELLDQKMKTQDLKLGLRSFTDLCECMKKNGLDLYKDFDLTGEKHLLVFTRIDKIKI